MTAYRQSWFEGWRLFGLLALTLTALCIWIAGMRGFEVDGLDKESASPFAKLRFGFEAISNSWNQWVLNYDNTKQKNLFKKFFKRKIFLQSTWLRRKNQKSI